MIERRRADRVHFVEPGLGGLRVVQDVEIARLGSHHAVVIAHGPLPCGERLLLEIHGRARRRPRTRCSSHVIDNRVVMDDGSLRRRVRLKMVQRAPRGSVRGSADHVATIRDGRAHSTSAGARRGGEHRPAVLSRVHPLSSRGQLVSWRCEPRPTIARKPCGSGACHRHRTLAWPYRMAAEFLTLGPTSPDSLRGLATIMSVGSPAATYR